MATLCPYRTLFRSELDSDNENNGQQLLEKIRRALGPLGLFLDTDELGIVIGDSGITVDNQQGHRSPANEAKIAKAKENLYTRGMAALDRLLDYLERNIFKYPDYADHKGMTQVTSCLLKTAYEFQDVGCVNIEYSALTYRHLLPILVQLQERYIKEWLGTLYTQVLTPDVVTANIAEIRIMCARFLANKTAELHTSQTSRQERTNNKGTQPEYVAVIRPLFSDGEASGNFFAEQAEYYAGKISSFLADHAEELGITPTAALDYNTKDKKIFSILS